MMKNQHVKKRWLLLLGMATVMMGLANTAEAKTWTRYCVVHAYSNDAPDVSTYFSMSSEDSSDLCNTGCENQWTAYLRANYDRWETYDSGVTWEYTASKAKNAYYQNKAYARTHDSSFDHASDFSCSID